MGSKTWESLPAKPLPNRANIVLTRRGGLVKCIPMEGIPSEIIKEARKFRYEDIWIIGGADIYEQFMPLIDEVHITRIKGSYKTDTKFPRKTMELFMNCRTAGPVEDDNGVKTQYEIWKKR
jgi:dihydrofolate reductase